jgi:hypothetical protein
MVTTRRSAQTIYYSLAGTLPRSLVDSLAAVFSQYERSSDGALLSSTPSAGAPPLVSAG